MSRLIRPATKVVVVPRDGELEITLNINITIDGQITATADNADVVTVQAQAVQEKEEEKRSQFIPDFASGLKLNFGKKEG